MDKYRLQGPFGVRSKDLFSVQRMVEETTSIFEEMINKNKK